MSKRLNPPLGRGLGAHEEARRRCPQSMSAAKISTTAFSAHPIHGERHSNTQKPNYTDTSHRCTSQTHRGDRRSSFFSFLFLSFLLLCISVYTEVWVAMHKFQNSQCIAQETLWKNKTDIATILSKPQH